MNGQKKIVISKPIAKIAATTTKISTKTIKLAPPIKRRGIPTNIAKNIRNARMNGPSNIKVMMSGIKFQTN